MSVDVCGMRRLVVWASWNRGWQSHLCSHAWCGTSNIRVTEGRNGSWLQGYSHSGINFWPVFLDQLRFYLLCSLGTMSKDFKWLFKNNFQQLWLFSRPQVPLRSTCFTSNIADLFYKRFCVAWLSASQLHNFRLLWTDPEGLERWLSGHTHGEFPSDVPKWSTLNARLTKVAYI